MASYRVIGLATVLASAVLLGGAWAEAADVRMLVAGTITVAVTSAAPSGSYDAQAWIRRYVEQCAGEHDLRAVFSCS